MVCPKLALGTPAPVLLYRIKGLKLPKLLPPIANPELIFILPPATVRVDNGDIVPNPNLPLLSSKYTTEDVTGCPLLLPTITLPISQLGKSLYQDGP